MSDAPADRTLSELHRAFMQHMDDDRRAFAELKAVVGDIGHKVDNAAVALQRRLGRLETDRVRRDAVREYRDQQAAATAERKTVRENLGMSRRTWWLGVFVAAVTVAGVVVSAIAVLAR